MWIIVYIIFVHSDRKRTCIHVNTDQKTHLDNTMTHPCRLCNSHKQIHVLCRHQDVSALPSSCDASSKSFNWLVVATPLKKCESVGTMKFPMYGNMKHALNHQPDNHVLVRTIGYWLISTASLSSLKQTTLCNRIWLQSYSFMIGFVHVY